MADKKLLKEVEAALEGEASDLLEWFRWAKWGQPVPIEMRPALCFVADALGEPYSWAQALAEIVEGVQGATSAGSGRATGAASGEEGQ